MLVLAAGLALMAAAGSAADRVLQPIVAALHGVLPPRD